MYIEKGSKIEIYEDPISKKKLEGMAIIESIDKVTHDFIFVTVNFSDYSGKVQRQIYIGS